MTPGEGGRVPGERMGLRASGGGCARLRRCPGRLGPRSGRGLSRGGRPAGGRGVRKISISRPLSAIVGHFGPLCLTVGGGSSVGVGFGNFDFPAIVGHFGPLCLTVGGGCSVRVGFGIRVALGELGAWGLFLVFRHQTSRCLSGYLVLALAIWGTVGHVLIIVHMFC